VPAYSQPQYLRRSLESVFSQTFRDYEVIITDDSPDQSVERVVGRFSQHANLRYHKNKVRKGSPGNWNEAVRLASGEYIKLLHHDDWFSEDKSLAEFVSMLEQDPQADFAFCSSVNCDEEQRLCSVHIPSDTQIRQLRVDPRVLFLGNFIGAPSATIYRSQVNQQFDPRLKWVVDIDFYIRVLVENRVFGVSTRPLVCTTVGADHQITHQSAGNKAVEVFEWLYLYKKLSQDEGFHYQRLKFIWRLLQKYDIASQQDIINCGVDFRIPRSVKALLLLRQMHRRIRNPC
jgi:glycosyltransferase involved in cell wall biosynthesis